MRVHAAVLLLTFGLSACAAPAPAPAPAPAEFLPTASVKEVMLAIIDPAADALWDSVEVVATVGGVERKQPRTDEEWMLLRRHALTLVEASNLLLVPGRHVATPGEKADDAQVDLHPEEVEALLVKDPAAWARHAHGLHAAAVESLKAIEAKDVTALLNAGETLDASCESCHQAYWYRPAPAVPPAGK